MNYLRAAFGVFLLCISACVFAAGDATLGQPLFENKTKPGGGCLGSNCHGTTAFQNTNKICSGTTSTAILNAFNNVGDMSALKTLYSIGFLTSVDVDNIAAYIAARCGPPAAPIATLTPATGLAFGSVQQGTTSAALTATLKNTGTATLNITSISITGTNASDFTKGTTTAVQAWPPRRLVRLMLRSHPLPRRRAAPAFPWSITQQAARTRWRFPARARRPLHLACL